MPYKIKNIELRIKNYKENLSFALEHFDYLLIPAISKKNKDKQEIKEIYETKILRELNNHFPILDVFKKESFFAEKDSSFLYANLKSSSMIFFGIGEPDLEIKTEYVFAKSLLNALKSIKKKSIQKLGIEIDSYFEIYKKINLKALLVNLLISFQDFTYHSLEAKETNKEIENLWILTQEEIPTEVFNLSKSILEARSSTMDLVNMPANIKTTNVFVEKAKSLEAIGLKVSIIDDIEWIRKHTPCFYIVAKGSLSSDPPKWIQVQYTPETEIRHKIALIGKSILFDTGGYQVKPDSYMNTMKADMTGGATVLSIIEQIKKLNLPYLQITVYCPVTSNKIDSDAMLPDSIVESASGKKVEIRHTDAEGRLTLIDALSLAENDGNDIFIIIATLTGAAARAVGPRIALMSTQRTLRKRFEKDCEEVYELFQSLEIEEEDYEDIKSKLDGADITNTGSEKYRGAQTAAAFIFSGLKDSNKGVLHLDIAGGDMDKAEKATGISIKGIMNFFWNLSKGFNAQK